MDGEDYIAGEEETEEELVNETPDIVYTELDEQENEDAGRVPKGISYMLVDGHLMVDVELDGSITASAKVYSTEPDMAMSFYRYLFALLSVDCL